MATPEEAFKQLESVQAAPAEEVKQLQEQLADKRAEMQGYENDEKFYGWLKANDAELYEELKTVDLTDAATGGYEASVKLDTMLDNFVELNEKALEYMENKLPDASKIIDEFKVATEYKSIFNAPKTGEIKIDILENGNKMLTLTGDPNNENLQKLIAEVSAAYPAESISSKAGGTGPWTETMIEVPQTDLGTSELDAPTEPEPAGPEVLYETYPGPDAIADTLRVWLPETAEDNIVLYSENSVFINARLVDGNVELGFSGPRGKEDFESYVDITVTDLLTKAPTASKKEGEILGSRTGQTYILDEAAFTALTGMPIPKVEGGTEPAPTEPEPAPTAPEPAPTAPEPAPTAPEPAPIAPEPAPTAPEPAPEAAPETPKSFISETETGFIVNFHGDKEAEKTTRIHELPFDKEAHPVLTSSRYGETEYTWDGETYLDEEGKRLLVFTGDVINYKTEETAPAPETEKEGTEQVAERPEGVKLSGTDQGDYQYRLPEGTSEVDPAADRARLSGRLKVGDKKFYYMDGGTGSDRAPGYFDEGGTRLVLHNEELFHPEATDTLPLPLVKEGFQAVRGNLNEWKSSYLDYKTQSESGFDTVEDRKKAVAKVSTEFMKAKEPLQAYYKDLIEAHPEETEYIEKQKAFMAKLSQVDGILTKEMDEAGIAKQGRAQDIESILAVESAPAPAPAEAVTAPVEPAPETAPEPAPEKEEEKPKKKGFWKRLFGGGDEESKPAAMTFDEAHKETAPTPEVIAPEPEPAAETAPEKEAAPTEVTPPTAEVAGEAPEKPLVLNEAKVEELTGIQDAEVVEGSMSEKWKEVEAKLDLEELTTRYPGLTIEVKSAGSHHNNRRILLKRGDKTERIYAFLPPSQEDAEGYSMDAGTYIVLGSDPSQRFNTIEPVAETGAPLSAIEKAVENLSIPETEIAAGTPEWTAANDKLKTDLKLTEDVKNVKRLENWGTGENHMDVAYEFDYKDAKVVAKTDGSEVYVKTKGDKEINAIAPVTENGIDADVLDAL